MTMDEIGEEEEAEGKGETTETGRERRMGRNSEPRSYFT